MVHVLKEVLNNEGIQTIGFKSQLKLHINDLNGIGISVIYETMLKIYIDDKIKDGLYFIDEFYLNHEKCKGSRHSFPITEYKPFFFVAIQAIEVASQAAIFQNQDSNFLYDKTSPLQVNIIIGDIIEIDNGVYSQNILIPASKADLLTGKGKLNLKTICNGIDTECDIVFDHENRNGTNLKITLKGHYQQQVDLARKKLATLVFFGINEIMRTYKTSVYILEQIIYVAKDYVARIIGSKGSVIRALQTVTKAYIRIEQHNLFSQESPRPLCLSGSIDDVANAKQLVQTLMHVEGEQYKHQVSTLFDQATAVNTVFIDIPQVAVGRLKGRGGETIRYLTTVTQTKINIDSNIGSEIARITIKGIYDMNVRKCQDSIQDLCIRNGEDYSVFDTMNLKKNLNFGYDMKSIWANGYIDFFTEFRHFGGFNFEYGAEFRMTPFGKP
jgi:rRNA processing protein Krr1/Pno1